MRKLLCLSVISVLILVLGCASTPTKSSKPDISKLPALQPLYSTDSGLALEVAKLPEFQNGVDEKNMVALARFTELVTEASGEEKAKLGRLLEVGFPNKRAYCAPLQALIWLIEKDESGKGTALSPLRLSLEELLDQAWDFSQRDRWKKFGTVIERLNAPELVNYYQRKQLRYDWEGKVFRALKRGRDDPGDPRYLFQYKEGTYRDFAAFAVYCLKKGGYQTKVLLVKNPDPRPAASGTKHKVCLFEGNDGKKYIIDNGRPDMLRRRGIVPLEEYSPFSEPQMLLKKGN